jgi:hypothetical protein
MKELPVICVCRSRALLVCIVRPRTPIALGVGPDLIGLPNCSMYLKLMIDGTPSKPFSAKAIRMSG